MLFRSQLERQKNGLFPSLSEYGNEFGITSDRIMSASPDVMIMHPGPVNRGVEITSEVADCDDSVINEQVTNGIAVRMAVMQMLVGKSTSISK